MTTIDSPILEKLKKLLTLGKDATGAEAETALAMATKLGIKYDIDISSIRLATGEQKKEEMVNDVLTCGARMSVAQKWISWLLHDHFKVNIVYGGSRWSGRIMYFLGRKSDVEFAKYVQDFLKEHMLRSWQYYQKANKVDTRYRATYFSNFYRGLDTKLKLAKKDGEKEGFAAVAEPVRAAAQSQYALALINENEERKQFMNKQFKALRNSPATRTSIYSNDAVSKAGFAAGQATNIARPLN
jgi:hypothetical protein